MICLTSKKQKMNGQSSIPFEIHIKLPYEVDINQKVEPQLEENERNRFDWIVINLKFKNEKDDYISSI